MNTNNSIMKILDLNSDGIVNDKEALNLIEKVVVIQFTEKVPDNGAIIKIPQRRMRYNLWSFDEDQILRTLYKTTPAKDLAFKLGRTLEATKKRAEVLGVRKHDRKVTKESEKKFTRWSQTEDTFLINLYNQKRKIEGKQRGIAVLEISKDIGRTPDSVNFRLSILKVK